MENIIHVSRNTFNYLKKIHLGRDDVCVILSGVSILLFSGLIISFLCGYLFAVSQLTEQPEYVYYYPWEYQIDRSNPKEAEILETREYQVKIPSDLYKHRDPAVTDLIILLRNLTGEELLLEDADTDIYWEIHYDTSACGYEFSELRKKNHFKDDGTLKQDKTTASINQDASPHNLKADALSWDLSAAEGYKSEEKIEQDIHSKFHKFNRKTKVKDLSSSFSFNTCGDIVDMFPYAFKHDVPNNAKVTQSNIEHFVWQYAFKGKMFHDTVKYKMSWTLYYSSLEHAITGDKTPTTSSEFSMRFYSLGEGYDYYDYIYLIRIANIYTSILEYYDLYHK